MAPSVRLIALTENGRLGPLYVEFPGEGEELTYLCSVHTALEQVSERRRERDMPVSRFESLDDAAGFVVRHHRLPSILAVEDVMPFIRFIFDHADGEAPPYPDLLRESHGSPISKCSSENCSKYDQKGSTFISGENQNRSFDNKFVVFLCVEWKAVWNRF
jgi:hypothetical protein